MMDQHFEDIPNISKKEVNRLLADSAVVKGEDGSFDCVIRFSADTARLLREHGVAVNEGDIGSFTIVPDREELMDCD